MNTPENTNKIKKLDLPVEGKNFAGDDTWNYLNDKTEIILKEEGKSEIDFLKRFVPSTESGECFEIGSFPGSNLPALASLGYSLNGVDISDRNEFELSSLLKSKGYKVGKFYSADIFKFKIDKKFDLVCSFGFVEHFENYLDVIKIHTQFVKEGGLLIITAPNYRGWVQYLVHSTLDRSNLKIHNIKSMRPKKWAKFLEAEGFEIIFQGYFGGLYFWLGNKGRNKLEKFILYILHGTSARLKRIIKTESSIYSYNCGIVARKKMVRINPNFGNP